jgi:hypothetical protein
MRKSLLIVFLLVFLVSAKTTAQLSKGSIWLGGSLNFSSTSNQESATTPEAKSSSITISPYVGIALSETSVAGMTLNFREVKQSDFAPFNRHEEYYGAGLFYRNYKNLGKNFYLFANGDLSYTHGRKVQWYRLDRSDVLKARIHTVKLAVYPGIAYAVSRRLHVELMIPDFIAVIVNDEDIRRELRAVEYSKGHSRSVEVSGMLNNVFSSWGVGFRYLIGR